MEFADSGAGGDCQPRLDLGDHDVGADETNLRQCEDVAAAFVHGAENLLMARPDLGATRELPAPDMGESGVFGEGRREAGAVARVPRRLHPRHDLADGLLVRGHNPFLPYDLTPGLTLLPSAIRRRACRGTGWW